MGQRAPRYSCQDPGSGREFQSPEPCLSARTRRDRISRLGAQHRLNVRSSVPATVSWVRCEAPSWTTTTCSASALRTVKSPPWRSAMPDMVRRSWPTWVVPAHCSTCPTPRSLTGQERTPIAAIAHLWAPPTQLGRSSTSSTPSCGQLAARVSWGAIITGLTRIAMSGWKCTVVPVVPSSATGVRSLVGTPCSYR